MLTSERKMGKTCEQQVCADVHYILENMDIIRDDIHRIADSLEEIANRG